MAQQVGKQSSVRRPCRLVELIKTPIHAFSSLSPYRSDPIPRNGSCKTRDDIKGNKIGSANEQKTLPDLPVSSSIQHSEINASLRLTSSASRPGIDETVSPFPKSDILMDHEASTKTEQVNTNRPEIKTQEDTAHRLPTKILKRIDEVQFLRRQARYKRNELVSTVVSWRESLQDLSTAPHTEQEQTRQDLLISIDDIETQLEALRELESSISTSETQLYGTEGQVKEYLKGLNPAALRTESIALSDSVIGEVHKFGEHVNMAPLLAQYFDRKGDVGILKERLQDLFEEYSDEKSQRILREDQELVLEPSSEIFEKQYEDRVHDLRAQIKSAEDAVRDLAEMCRQEGLDTTNDEGYPESATQMFQAYNPLPPIVSRTPNDLFDYPTVVISGSDRKPTVDDISLQHASRVKNWVDNVHPTEENSIDMANQFYYPP